MLIHDIVKIKLLNKGYLPNNPYHLISDSEMCDAFLNYFESNYPEPDMSSSLKLIVAYEQLLASIKYHISALSVVSVENEPLMNINILNSNIASTYRKTYYFPLTKNSLTMVVTKQDATSELLTKISYTDDTTGILRDSHGIGACSVNYTTGEINFLSTYDMSDIIDIRVSYKRNPDSTMSDWIYSYILESAVGPKSSEKDRHDLLVLLGVDTLDDEFTDTAKLSCLEYSTQWIANTHAVDMRYNVRTDESKGITPETINTETIESKYINYIYGRPATIYGEPHVIKYLRLLNLNS